MGGVGGICSGCGAGASNCGVGAGAEGCCETGSGEVVGVKRLEGTLMGRGCAFSIDRELVVSDTGGVGAKSGSDLSRLVPCWGENG